MSTHDPQTVLLPWNLGAVGNYDPTVPLARISDKNSLHASRLYLRATLDEMIKIRRMSKCLPDHYDLLRETKAKYDNLLQKQSELEAFERRNWLYRFLQPKLKRAARTFANDAHELWDSTMTASDKLKRVLLSTHSVDLLPVPSNSLAKDELVSGLAVDLNGPLTKEAIDTVREAVSILASVSPLPNPTSSDNQEGHSSSAGTTLVDDTSSSARSSISASPTSPDSTSGISYLNFHVNYNVVNNVGGSTPGMTINNDSSGTRGSEVHLDQCPSRDSSPS